MAVERISNAMMTELLSNIQNNATQTSDISFNDLLNETIDEINQTEQTTLYDAAMISVGDMDALHNLTINMAKADIAIQTLVQVRNKAIDAYNEIMRITL
ncbi:MAG: flagellar hook-basal body complex protein FliE [Eubacteriales bacterium]